MLPKRPFSESKSENQSSPVKPVQYSTVHVFHEGLLGHDPPFLQGNSKVWLLAFPSMIKLPALHLNSAFPNSLTVVEVGVDDNKVSVGGLGMLFEGHWTEASGLVTNKVLPLFA